MQTGRESKLTNSLGKHGKVFTTNALQAYGGGEDGDTAPFILNLGTGCM